MSFVSIIVNNDFLSVMADSRVVELYVDGRIHRIITEDLDKIQQVSDRAFYTITGANEDAADFILKAEMINTLLIDGLLIPEEDVLRWFDDNKHLLTKNFHFRISFGGLSIYNRFEVYTITNIDESISRLYYDNEKLGYSLSQSQYILDEDFPTEQFKQLYDLYNGTLESMQMVQSLLNDIIADNDASVNKNKKTFWLART